MIASVGVVFGVLGGLPLDSHHTTVRYDINFSIVTVVFVWLYLHLVYFRLLGLQIGFCSLETLDSKQSILKMYRLSHLN